MVHYNGSAPPLEDYFTNIPTFVLSYSEVSPQLHQIPETIEKDMRGYASSHGHVRLIMNITHP